MHSLLPFHPSTPLFIFYQMQLSSLFSNHHTIRIIVQSLSILRFLHSTLSLHSHILKLGFFSEYYISSFLLHFYSLCSDSDSAIHLFDNLPLEGVVAQSSLIARISTGFDFFSRMPQQSLFTWNSLTQGFAFLKGGAMALKLLFRMEEEGVIPDAVMLVGVLTACSHSGLVELERRIFDMVLRGKFGFKTGIKHYGCMVDLYGSAGLMRLSSVFR